ncbi:MAG: PemK-like, MazF-like toxin of type II toxin-antitoxin system [Candidatus Kentron sp. G]|nr:MAG: PemK-like, MazF-like toxin of type II toxin-antitoxin system [Candidatus Kentron sp. G]VFN03433.1 MAG: PemK-like, MazF-like toxin of type II toxin-antitoxin system [Candidatus Kentron sp. G]VFN04328.1 MAG: PemK-like, MazF-like toxin of type II toxin-antitoxin system [Candidatus Kentron sp. G]
MTTYSFGNVVLVSFPFTNLQTTKKRPAVVISQKTYQQNQPDVILMAITSRIRLPLAMGEATLKDWRVAGLAKPSVLKRGRLGGKERTPTGDIGNMGPSELMLGFASSPPTCFRRSELRKVIDRIRESFQFGASVVGHGLHALHQYW